MRISGAKESYHALWPGHMAWVVIWRQQSPRGPREHDLSDSWSQIGRGSGAFRLEHLVVYASHPFERRHTLKVNK